MPERRIADPMSVGVPSRVLPGEIKTSRGPGEALVTVLGSCVAACVRNPHTGSGGMNHLMLPESETGDWNGAGTAGRYGNFAMDALISEVLKTGCKKEDLEIKLFGGANLYRGSVMIGSMNVHFVKNYMTRHGLMPAAQDLGGAFARKIIYIAATGLVRRQMLRAHSHDEMLQLETANLKPIKSLKAK